MRELGDNPGFGTAANEVLRLVEGDNGFFCICHDDVALEPDAIRALVEELYRSNAGIVGPKLVTGTNSAGEYVSDRAVKPRGATPPTV